MSERTAPSLAKLDELLPLVKALPDTPVHRTLVDETEHLRRAVAAFHMEAIRFRMYNVDHAIKAEGDPANLRHLFEELRHLLEAVGFHTRSHAAPGT
jgi:hypothetical protein